MISKSAEYSIQFGGRTIGNRPSTVPFPNTLRSPNCPKVSLHSYIRFPSPPSSREAQRSLPLHSPPSLLPTHTRGLQTKAILGREVENRWRAISRVFFSSPLRRL
ncbi:hypothetical protein CDAR_600081 [Caerostris darwini]|uniref:Uncharacterized protein n=1 Tax=Caerostris darwini TaxID=1538125 RepID=A0AAV4STI3_9ARAC|nr:hypothetical protein CDAR_600081 [Caerostris darwini]